MVCAKEMNIPQVSEYMERLGITDEEMEQISDQMMGLLDGDSFEMGGSGFMPDFLQNMLGGSPTFEKPDSSDDKKDTTQNGKAKMTLLKSQARKKADFSVLALKRIKGVKRS